MRSPTAHKFRHYRPDPDGQGDVLLWAQSADKTMYEADGEHDQIFRGRQEELEVINDALWTPNALADEGEVDILDTYFDTAALKTNFYLGLSQSTPVEASTLASMPDPGGEVNSRSCEVPSAYRAPTSSIEIGLGSY